MTVYVVTGLHLGWDCVVGVYTISTPQDLVALNIAYPSDDYIVTEQEVMKFDLADIE
jgi:hypothetical protein